MDDLSYLGLASLSFCAMIMCGIVLIRENNSDRAFIISGSLTIFFGIISVYLFFYVIADYFSGTIPG